MVSSSLPHRKPSSRLVGILLIVYYFFEGIVVYFIPQKWRFRSIAGETVLITGAASGIGQLMAVKFARLGIANLVLWDVNEAGLQQTVELIKNDASDHLDLSRVFTYKVNLAKRDEIVDTAQKVKSVVGTVDILVNNAGIVSGQRFLDTPDDRIKLTFEINTLAHYYTVKCFLPDMIQQRRGHIVTVASTAGHMVAPKLVDYCGSKFANVGFDLALRMELAQANLDDCIRTTIVKPYLINTGMFSGAKSGMLPSLNPDYVAQCVVDGVLAGDREVILPRYVVIMFALLQILPHKAYIECIEVGGAMDALDDLHARQVFNNKQEEVNNN